LGLLIAEAAAWLTNGGWITWVSLAFYNNIGTTVPYNTMK